MTKKMVAFESWKRQLQALRNSNGDQMPQCKHLKTILPSRTWLQTFQCEAIRLVISWCIRNITHKSHKRSRNPADLQCKVATVGRPIIKTQQADKSTISPTNRTDLHTEYLKEIQNSIRIRRDHQNEQVKGAKTETLETQTYALATRKTMKIKEYKWTNKIKTLTCKTKLVITPI